MLISNNILYDFNPIELSDLNKVQLLNRKDTKYVLNMAQLQPILEKLLQSYNILKIDNNLTFEYDNKYFDTENFLFYYQHHNEKRNRYKIRFRNYRSINKTYFEIKTKNNKNRTVKKRLLSEHSQENFSDAEINLINQITGISHEDLNQSLNVRFSRMTLVDYQFNERLTIDTNLVVKNGKDHKIFENLVIAEIKQSKYNPKSPFIKSLRELKISEMKFSKYCMGMIHLYDHLKKNRFKPKLFSINKILNQDIQQGQ